MKKIILCLLIFSSMLGFVACEKEGDITTVKLVSTPNISAPTSGTSYVFEEANASDTLPVIKWSAADFGFQAAITYKVEVAEAGTSFAAPQSLGAISGTELELTVAAFNTALITMGLTPLYPLPSKCAWWLRSANL